MRLVYVNNLFTYNAYHGLEISVLSKVILILQKITKSRGAALLAHESFFGFHTDLGDFWMQTPLQKISWLLHTNFAFTWSS